jgi:predicted acylesterase/phospholipase RssA
MPRLGLALSGGGFRATLYHLGVVRYLRDAGQLENVTDIASVSGGSILAAHLALNWDRYSGDDDRFAEAASEIVRFVKYDVRNHIVRRLPAQWFLKFFTKLSRSQVRTLTPNAILERYYRKFLYGDRCLYELPERPMLHILTTNVSNGGLSVFNRNGLFIQQRQVTGSSEFQHIPGQLASIPRVVGASSAFPGFFPPVEITAADLGVRVGQYSSEWFTDGGVYDNLSMRAFAWLKQQGAQFDQVLVSDAGKPFQILSDAALGVLGQSVRATDILWDRVWQLERDNFGQQPGFVFLPMSEVVDLSEDLTALHPVMQAEVQSIRTDIDRFSDAEINALAQHGYEVARKVLRQMTGDQSGKPSQPPWAPIPTGKRTTHTASNSKSFAPSTATKLARELGKSSRRRVWTTLLDPRDWPSYVYVFIALVLFVYLPAQVYRLYEKSRTQAIVIDAIASGDPDFREVLGLLDKDPTSDWATIEIVEKPGPTELDYSGLEVLTHSRMLDFRKWNPDETSPERQGRIRLRDRLTFKLVDSESSRRRVTFRTVLPIEDAEFRQPKEQLQAAVSRVKKPLEVFDGRGTTYEIEYDLSRTPFGEPVTIEIAMLARFPGLMSGRAPFVVQCKTDLLAVWLLFPEHRPYRKYSLLRYPADESAPPQMMNPRDTIDHPYGFLIGWSVVNPQVGTVYECRWTTK